MIRKPTALLTIFLVLSLLTPFVSGCGGQTAAPEAHSLHMAPLSDMPDMVRTASPIIQQAYQFAAANADITSQMPCYCGCGPIGHKSLYNYYVAEAAADGALTYDLHAVNCKICVDITQDVMRLLREGQGVDEIRPYIDQEYARYGPST
jgi:hypothetical protein